MSHHATQAHQPRPTGAVQPAATDAALRPTNERPSTEPVLLELASSSSASLRSSGISILADSSMAWAQLVNADSVGCITNPPLPAGPPPPSNLLDRQTTATLQNHPNFTTLARIGSGGMGVVFSATDPDTRRSVAIKFEDPVQAHHDPGLRLWAKREALFAQLTERMPGVVQIHGEGTAVLADGATTTRYLVMSPFHQNLAALAREPNSLGTALQVLTSVAQGLDSLEKAGIVHCDLKPANILVDRNWNSGVIADFGLAVQPNGALGNPLAGTNRVAGTPEYMAPEQARGEPPTSKADQFTFGLILYETVYGRLPEQRRFDRIPQADWPDRQQDTAFDFPRLPATEHPALVAIMKRCLEHDPKDRYANAKELFDDLIRYHAIRGGESPAPLVRAAATLFEPERSNLNISYRLHQVAATKEFDPQALAVFAQYLRHDPETRHWALHDSAPLSAVAIFEKMRATASETGPQPYRSAGELADDLTRFAEGRAVGAREFLHPEDRPRFDVIAALRNRIGESREPTRMSALADSMEHYGAELPAPLRAIVTRAERGYGSSAGYSDVAALERDVGRFVRGERIEARADMGIVSGLAYDIGIRGRSIVTKAVILAAGIFGTAAYYERTPAPSPAAPEPGMVIKRTGAEPPRRESAPERNDGERAVRQNQSAAERVVPDRPSQPRSNEPRRAEPFN